MVREGRKNTSEGYITSKQMRMFLTYFGVSFHQAAHEIPPQLMYTFQEACDKAMTLSPPTNMTNRINRLLVATDWRESQEGKVRGHLDHTVIEMYLKDHGMSEEEILLSQPPSASQTERVAGAAAELEPTGPTEPTAPTVKTWQFFISHTQR